MDMKDAVSLARSSILELLADESVGNVGLEEVAFDAEQALWWVTIGFSRPWQVTIGFMPVSGQGPGRCYKVIAISDSDGRVVSVRDRDLSP
jgi:hypothetical protein